MNAEIVVPPSIKSPHKRLLLVVCDKFKNEFHRCVSSGYVYDTNRIIDDKLDCKLSCYNCIHFWKNRKKKTWYTDIDIVEIVADELNG